MRDPDDFDAFYKDARDRLLVQTYAMTGDLVASRRAVRDAFVVAWQRWRKLSRLDSPEDVVRPHAWRLAQRRHTARVWHREQDIAPEVRDALEALGQLSVAQRKALVLTQLAAVSMPQMAREVGLPLERAERELQSGAAALSLALDVEVTGLRTLFEGLGTAVVGQGQFPRATIVRRSGAARRRAHTLVGAAAAVAAVVVSGSLVTDAAGVRPTLDAAGTTTPIGPPEAVVDEQVPVMLPETTLLTGSDLDRFAGRSWAASGTGDNSAGNGLVLPCQLERYADPRGRATLVRTFRSSGGAADSPQASAVQVIEASRGVSGARRAFRTTALWLGGCNEARVQLLGTRTPGGVGDESVQLVLRSWAKPVTTYVVGVARTGLFTTTTAFRLGGDAVPDRDAAAALLASSVTRLCAEPEAGACAPSEPELTDRDPLPAGRQPAMLSEVDLPPVTGIDLPWVGTEPQKALMNAAATGCDETTFDGRFAEVPFTRNATRTFLVPEAELPQEFGLTETVASLPPEQAEALVERVRERLTSCPERDLNTEVERIARRDEGVTALTAWRLDVKVTDERSITYLMAIMRHGPGVAQLGFIPARGATLSPETFVELAERALVRLDQMPPPPRR